MQRQNLGCNRTFLEPIIVISNNRGLDLRKNIFIAIMLIITINTFLSAIYIDNDTELDSYSLPSSPKIKGADMTAGLCNIKPVVRHTYKAVNDWASKQSIEMEELAIVCSKLRDAKWLDMLQGIYNNFDSSKHNNKISLNQITIQDSDPMVILSAIDLFCDRFDCSKMTVFNISGHKFQDLGKWISSWPNLEVVDLSNTSLTSIESILQPDSSIQQLSNQSTISFNQLSHQPMTTLTNLTHLILDYNNITELDFGFITKRMPNLRHLSLINNSIFNITYNDSHLTRLRSPFETLNLAGNSINCEKSQLKFIQLLQDPNYASKFPDNDLIGCASRAELVEMSWPQRMSVLKTPLCDQCICRSVKLASLTIDCYGRNLTSLPSVLPLNAKRLNLTSNQIDSLELPPNAKNWENVTYLHLDDNYISSIDDLKGKHEMLKNLAQLDLRKNKLEMLNTDILINFKIDSIYLSDNPWSCKCSYMKQFAEWIQVNFQKVGDEEDVRCGISGNDINGIKSIDRGEDPLAGKVIHRIPPKVPCPVSLFLDPFEFMDAVNIFLASTMLLAILKTLLDYMYQKRTKRLPIFYKINLWW